MNHYVTKEPKLPQLLMRRGLKKMPLLHSRIMPLEAHRQVDDAVYRLDHL